MIGEKLWPLTRYNFEVAPKTADRYLCVDGDQEHYM